MLNGNEKDKKYIRSEIRELKKSLSLQEIEDKSKQIIENLMNTVEYKQASSIYTYVNYNQEVITIDLIKKSLDEGKNVYVPKVCESLKSGSFVKEMKFYKILSLQNLKLGTLGILEPVDCVEDSEHKGLLIMPGLAFDTMHHRIGYGGGFYDRYLSQPHKHNCIALCFELQMYDEFQTEEFDIKPDMIITESNVY